MTPDFPFAVMLAPFGKPPFEKRRSASGAVWHFAPCGSSRRVAVGAVWQLAPSGSWRRLAVGAVRLFS
jgi:hypothetical protein